MHSVGFGGFAASSAVFFTRSVGLEVGEVGVGTAVAGLGAVVTSVLAGRLADLVGPRNLLVVLSALQAVLFAGYVAVHDFSSFLVVICALTAADHGARVARSTVIAGLADGAERVRLVRLRACLRSLSKLGVSLGTLVAAVPLEFDTRQAYLAVVLCNAMAAAFTTAIVTRLPSPRRPPADRQARGWVALRDRTYMGVAALCGLVATHRSLMTLALPLWVTTRTEAPDAVVAALFLANTAVSIALQVRASRGADTVEGARRAAGLGARLVAPACVLFASAAWAPSTTAVVLLFAGVAVLTAGELWMSGATWSLSFELADSRAPGQYQGAFALGMSAETVAGPLLATGLVLWLGTAGWLLAGGLFVAAAASVTGAVRRALATCPPVVRGVGATEPTMRIALADPTERLEATMRIDLAGPTVRACASVMPSLRSPMPSARMMTEKPGSSGLTVMPASGNSVASWRASTPPCCRSVS